jgi:hypothetical protein
MLKMISTKSEKKADEKIIVLESVDESHEGLEVTTVSLHPDLDGIVSLKKEKSNIDLHK